ncbi:MAG: Ppx/GppA phosphatase family protein [Syntrophorhabdales bacterium]|jgi:exopolyphosphatase/guanosine-5'-triphosphate,3'-diphosphate pyrophosphatase
MRYGSIDIGTNAVLLLVMESNGQLDELYDASTITRLGEGVLATGRLIRPAMERTVGALVRYRRVLDDYGVETLDCFGTAALREAENRAEFVEMAWQRAGIRVRVIRRYEEAYYTYLSVKDDPRIEGEELLIVDIGGGSTEITRGTRHGFLGYVSLPLGTVKLTERFIRHDPPLAEELANLSGFVHEQAGRARRRRVGRKGSDNRSIVGMAGTVTTLAAMVLGLDAFDKKKVHGMVISLATLREWRERLLAMTVEERKGLPGMEPGREDLIPQGVVLMEEIVVAFGGTQFTVSTAGARYGVLYEALKPLRRLN